MKFFRPLLTFLFHLGYFGPLVMGVMDSSFLVLPFGNDLVVVGLVAQNHRGAPFYVLSAAIGSTLGALLLALVGRKVGEKGIQKLAGRKFDMLKKHIRDRAAIAIGVGALAPPPFPYTLVIAAASAFDYTIWRILVVNFIARAIRFTILAILAIEFGRYILQISKSAPFLWTMAVFILICLVGERLLHLELGAPLPFLIVLLFCFACTSASIAIVFRRQVGVIRWGRHLSPANKAAR